MISTQMVIHYLGYYLKWDPQNTFIMRLRTQASDPITRTVGTYSKYSSIDDKIDAFHYYTTLIKFGLGEASYDAAQEIRNGKITREKALLWLRSTIRISGVFLNDFLEYIDMTKVEFENIIDSFRPAHLWDKDMQGNWRLRCRFLRATFAFRHYFKSMFD